MWLELFFASNLLNKKKENESFSRVLSLECGGEFVAHDLCLDDHSAIHVISILHLLEIVNREVNKLELREKTSSKFVASKV